jgi:hypothetical protein
MVKGGSATNNMHALSLEEQAIHKGKVQTAWYCLSSLVNVDCPNPGSIEVRRDTWILSTFYQIPGYQSRTSHAVMPVPVASLAPSTAFSASASATATTSWAPSHSRLTTIPPTTVYEMTFAPPMGSLPPSTPFAMPTGNSDGMEIPVNITPSRKDPGPARHVTHAFRLSMLTPDGAEIRTLSFSVDSSGIEKERREAVQLALAEKLKVIKEIYLQKNPNADLAAKPLVVKFPTTDELLENGHLLPDGFIGVAPYEYWDENSSGRVLSVLVVAWKIYHFLNHL